MATSITIRTRSGEEVSFTLDAEAHSMTPVQCAEKFHDGIQLAELVTLRMENRIFMVREIESIAFN
jgi:hypothetical protein